MRCRTVSHWNRSPIFLEREPFPFGKLVVLRGRSRRTRSSSLREIQSCAGPRTKIFLCSVINKRNKSIHTGKSGKKGGGNIIERCGSVCMKEWVCMISPIGEGDYYYYVNSSWYLSLYPIIVTRFFLFLSRIARSTRTTEFKSCATLHHPQKRFLDSILLFFYVYQWLNNKNLW